MEKTYQEQAIAFLLKAVIGLGSVYLITEKFVGQIDHLFHLDSIRTALLIFHLIYFVSPVAVVCAYFFLKKGSMQLYSMGANRLLAYLSYLYLIFLIAAFYLPIKPSLYIGGILIFISVGFMYVCMAQRPQQEHKKQMFQYLSIAFIIILFAFSYLIRNDRTATRFEKKYFTDLPGHFQAMDSVDNYLNAVQNKFQFEPEDTLDTVILKNYFKQTGAGDTIQFATNDELIRLAHNRWGLFINLLSYKALLALLPFTAVVLGFIFLLTTNHPKSGSTTLLKKQGDDYEVSIPQAVHIPEKEFLKVVFVILITLIIPVLHPLETIKATFAKPVSFTDSKTVTVTEQHDTPRVISGTLAIKDSVFHLVLNTQFGDTVKLSTGGASTTIDNRTYETNINSQKVKLDSLKTALKNLNENLVLFSTYFGDGVKVDDENFMAGAEEVNPRLFFVRRKKQMKHEVFKK